MVVIISILLALAVGGSTARPQLQYGGSCPPWMCGADTNHNETLVRDTAPVK